MENLNSVDSFLFLYYLPYSFFSLFTLYYRLEVITQPSTAGIYGAVEQQNKEIVGNNHKWFEADHECVSSSIVARAMRLQQKRHRSTTKRSKRSLP